MITIVNFRFSLNSLVQFCHCRVDLRKKMLRVRGFLRKKEWGASQKSV